MCGTESNIHLYVCMYGENDTDHMELNLVDSLE